MARKAKKAEAPENHERWLITYADLITLLLVFFIIMYAMSKIDQSKFDVLAKVLMFQFQKSDSALPKNAGVSGNANPAKGGHSEDTLKSTAEQLQQMQAQQQQQQQQEITQQQQEQMQREKDLQELNEKLQKYIDENQLQAQVVVNNRERGVAITLNDLFLFDLGKADLKPAAYPILDKLAGLLPSLNTKISIEGHTDNLPLATGNPFGDNWGLSNSRSLSVLHYFTRNAKLPDNMFISVGYADTMPVVPNDSDANRQKNRRVEIIVLRDPPSVE
jgi:chemotaxis protein MotB